MKYVNQKDIKELIRERLASLANFIGKPLIIGRSMFDDGIQAFLLREFFQEYNQGRPDEHKRWFRTLREGITPNRYLGVYVMNATVESINSPENISLIERAKAPIIIYLCDECQSGEMALSYADSSFRIFKPDFDDWAKDWRCRCIPDFIRGDGNETGIIYRWYNHFNCQKGELQGCDFPREWINVWNSLSLSMRAKGVNKLCMLTEDNVRWAFNRARISDDVVEDFLRYIFKTK